MNNTRQRTSHGPSKATIDASQGQQGSSRTVQNGRVSKNHTKKHKNKSNTSSGNSLMWNGPIHDKKGSNSRITNNYKLRAATINLYVKESSAQSGYGGFYVPSLDYILYSRCLMLLPESPALEVIRQFNSNSAQHATSSTSNLNDFSEDELLSTNDGMSLELGDGGPRPDASCLHSPTLTSSSLPYSDNPTESCETNQCLGFYYDSKSTGVIMGGSEMETSVTTRIREGLDLCGFNRQRALDDLERCKCCTTIYRKEIDEIMQYLRRQEIRASPLNQHDLVWLDVHNSYNGQGYDTEARDKMNQLLELLDSMKMVSLEVKGYAEKIYQVSLGGIFVLVSLY